MIYGLMMSMPMIIIVGSKKAETQAKSYEKMRRDDNLYKYGIVIEYNTNPVIKGYGSAIFFHVWGGENITTEGCVAVSEENIIKILEWLNPKAEPLIIMGIEDTTWRLPLMKSKIVSYRIYTYRFMLFRNSSVSSYCADKIPEGFVDIKEVIPEIQLDIRYFGPHNFVGERVDGYLAPKCILTKEAAEALSNVQKELEQFSLTLKIYDCYRPQRAVDHFVRWAKEIDNTKTKKEFYPTVDKRNLV